MPDPKPYDEKAARDLVDSGKDYEERFPTSFEAWVVDHGGDLLVHLASARAEIASLRKLCGEAAIELRDQHTENWCSRCDHPLQTPCDALAFIAALEKASKP